MIAVDLPERPAQPLEIDDIVSSARRASLSWRQSSIRNRLERIRELRRRLAGDCRSVTRQLCGKRAPEEFLASQLIPFLDACRFLEKHGLKLLKTRRLGWSPLWLWGTTHEVRREPFGVVLIIGPSNYPFFLPGVQTIQALVAGNVVLLKPGRGGSNAATFLARNLRLCGVPKDVVTVLPEAELSAGEAVDAKVDKIILTGSAETGLKVLKQAANHLTPSTMELSGCDAVFVAPDADIKLAARAVAYGLHLNEGRTCIAPRRVIAWQEIFASFKRELIEACGKDRPIFVDDLSAAEYGGRALHLVAVPNLSEAVGEYQRSSYRLGASIFTASSTFAEEISSQIDAGSVCINDLIVPTADGRLPFGGRKESGFGVTRGAEGLLELTQVKVVSHRWGHFRPHLREKRGNEFEMLSRIAGFAYGSGMARWKALIEGTNE